MQIEILQRIISEGQQLIGNINLIERPAFYEQNGNYVFVGLRQTGKSYMLYARMKELLREGVNLKRLVLVNFDDERVNMKADELDQIVQAQRAMTDEPPIFFFDEIQNIDGWERFARRLANYKYRVYITGSNAKMLSREISTTLGGRYWTRQVLPYSFCEYMRAARFELSEDWRYGAQDADIERLFHDYFYFGGMPEIVNVATKRAWLNEMFSKILLSDIVVRNHLRSEEVLRLVVRRLADCVMQPLALNRLTGLIKSTGAQIGRNTLTDYIGYLHDSCLIFSIENYAASFSEKATAKKHYFSDNGLLNIFLRTPDTLLLENIVAISLLRRYGAGNFYFYRANIEIDFLIPEERQALQVSWSIDQPETRSRELSSLEKFHSRFPDYSLAIVTRHPHLQSLALSDGTPIRTVSVARWVIEIDGEAHKTP